MCSASAPTTAVSRLRSEKTNRSTSCSTGASYRRSRRSCIRRSIMANTLRWRCATSSMFGALARPHRRDAESPQYREGARAAGLQPDFVQPQDILVAVRVRVLRHFVEHVHEPLELLRKLQEHRGERLAAQRASHVLSQRAVGASAHGDVIVDIDELAREALREEPRDEQGDVAEATQRCVALL